MQRPFIDLGLDHTLSRTQELLSRASGGGGNNNGSCVDSLVGDEQQELSLDAWASAPRTNNFKNGGYANSAVAGSLQRAQTAGASFKPQQQQLYSPVKREEQQRGRSLSNSNTRAASSIGGSRKQQQQQQQQQQQKASLSPSYEPFVDEFGFGAQEEEEGGGGGGGFLHTQAPSSSSKSNKNRSNQSHQEQQQHLLQQQQQPVLKKATSFAGYVAEPWSPSPSPERITSEALVVESMAKQQKSRYVEEMTKLSSSVRKVVGAVEQGKGEQLVLNLAITAAVPPLRSVNTKGATGGAGAADSSHFAAEEEVEGARVLSTMLRLAKQDAILTREIEARIEAEKMQARAEVAFLIKRDQDVEKEREERVGLLAARTLEARVRVKTLRVEKAQSASQRAAEKQNKKEQEDKKNEANAAQHRAVAAAAALEKRLRIQEEQRVNNELLEQNYLAHMEQVNATLKRREEEQKAMVEKKSAEREQLIREKGLFAQEKERELIQGRVDFVKNKQQMVQEREKLTTMQRQRTSEERQTHALHQAFLAEQRRALISKKREGEQEVGRIRLAKEAVLNREKRKINAERPARLHAIFAAQIRQQHAVATEGKGSGSQMAEDDSLETSPGPGEYFQVPSESKPRGGYLASSRPVAEYSKTPGPGAYDPSGVPKVGGGGGVIPFMGRGKTDVDWTILAASKMPGVGDYDLSSGKQRSGKGAIPFPKKGGTQLEHIIANAGKLPGPGSYDLDRSATAKAGGIESFLRGE